MKTFKYLTLSTILLFAIASCKKDSSNSSTASPIAGFWTYKEDAANDYWNFNVQFKNDGTFKMYNTLSLADTAAAQAIADTAGAMITFGTYTVKGTTVTMTWQEFSVIGFTFSGTLNSNSTNLVGDIETNQPGSASPHWVLTKP